MVGTEQSSQASRARLALAVAGLLAAVVLVAPGAWGQTETEVAARRLLLERAEVARRDGRHDESLDLAGRAGQISMTPSLRLFIAEEQVAVGRVAEALGTADLCLRDVERDTTARNREAVRGRCEGLRRALVGRVGQVVVRVPEPTPEALQVTVAGQALHPSLYGAPTVVTPGAVEVTATARGRQPWRATLDVAAGATAETRVELQDAPPPRAEPPPPAPRPLAAPAPPVTLAALRPPRAPRPRVAFVPRARPDAGSLQRTLGWVAGGTAVVFLGGAVAANVLHEGVASDATAQGCAVEHDGSIAGGQTCLDDLATMDAARTLAIVGYVGAGVLAVASVVLLVTAPSSTRAAPRAGLTCGPGPGVGVACAGMF